MPVDMAPILVINADICVRTTSAGGCQLSGSSHRFCHNTAGDEQVDSVTLSEPLREWHKRAQAGPVVVINHLCKVPASMAEGSGHVCCGCQLAAGLTRTLMRADGL